ncbi:MarR family winged helix-turn-helix transcriptional regulator [Agromyces seonyuensis]|uniref:MarR family transcriptional regulator n=1 Tax=Agromyces seonyuensis TaxID=2662446 RepID=A0A6I4P152_9MICO|nr:MarR family transcriptional regulator [Agromyces seonyuensis]MWB96947.1 MarR family transcriptional regulator [Agromyces seonyuensis]
MDVTVLDRLLQISELFQRDLANAFAGTPLTTARVRVLWVLAHRGPSAQHDLADALETSPRNVTGLVDALEAAGYVRRAPHPTDRRAYLVELTAVASEQMERMRVDHAELSAALLAAVPESDRDALERGVAAIADRLETLVLADEAARAAVREASA